MSDLNNFHIGRTQIFDEMISEQRLFGLKSICFKGVSDSNAYLLQVVKI